MAIQIADGFQLRVAKPLDDRQNVETVAQLDPTYGYEGQIVYVKDIKQFYTCYKDENGSLAYKVMETGNGGGGASPEKQIKDWVSGSSYLEGDYIYYEGDIYRCLNSNNTIDFGETNWKKLTYGIDELSKEDVERLLGLTKEEIEAMADLILDTEAKLDKTYSSSKIHDDIQQCLEDSKTYTLEELEKVKIDDTLTTTDKTITGAINEVNGNLLDTVGFSADYKNIILNRKNGLNPYTIPISAVINNASLAELKDIDSTDIGNGKTLVYDSSAQKHKYVNTTSTDEFVKMDNTTDAKYLSDLIDKSTVVNDNGVLKVKKLDGQEVTITEINYLKGLTMNVMDLVNAFSNGGVKVLNTPLNTASELDTMDRTSFTDGISYIVYVLADETHSNAKTTYLCTKNSTTFFGNADSQRNFTTNPIDLANEVTGKLGTSNIDVDNLWTLLTINDNYETLTTNNEIFGTHGAKAMYDELLTEIGAKANATDLTTHTNNTDIHVTTTDKAKWNKVIDKVNTVDFNTHKNNTDIHITNDERTKWDKVDEKVDKTDIVDNLTSTDTDKPLSANQGKVLKDKLEDIDGSKKLYITNTGANIKFVKITSAPINGSSIYIHFKSARTNTTFEEETVRISKYVSNTVYDGKIIQKSVYATNGNKPNENEANFLVILDDYSVWAHIASYSTAEIELYSYARNQSIDGTEATTLPSEVKYSMFNGVEIATMDKLNYSTVEDVGVTTIKPVNSNITGNIEYTVKNGICYVSMKDLMSTVSSTNLLISTTMPKPSIDCTASSVNAGGNIAMIYIDKNTTNLRGNFYTKNAKSDCSFSYPVAE